MSRPRSLESKRECPEEFICPIMKAIMTDPVITGKGWTYERAAIVAWLARSNIEPMTGERLTSIEMHLIPNRALKHSIDGWKEQNRLEQRAEQKTETRSVPLGQSLFFQTDRSRYMNSHKSSAEMEWINSLRNSK